MSEDIPQRMTLQKIVQKFRYSIPKIIVLPLPYVQPKLLITIHRFTPMIYRQVSVSFTSAAEVEDKK